MTRRFGRMRLVGRDTELARVQAALTAPESAGVVLVGPGGVGKSHLARACLPLAERAGFRTAQVLATRSAAAIPLGALAALLPECGEDPATLQRARATLVGLAAEQPLVLLVDDAHLLDEVSASLVLSVSADPRVVPLLTVRTGERCPDAVTAVWKDLGAERIEVEPLGARPTGELLTELLGGAVAPETVDRLSYLSAGRPLALRELVAAARDGGQLVERARGWELVDDPGVPPALAELVDQALARLGDGARELVETLALCEPLPLAVIERLGLGDDLDALEAGGLVTVADEAGEHRAGAIVPVAGRHERRLTARLDHPLYVESVLAGLGRRRRGRLLARAGAALAEASADERDHVRSVLWRHWSGEALDPRLLIDAARRFYAGGDYRRCGELAGAAWRARRSFAAGHLYGFALGREGRCEEADEVLAETEALARTDREIALVTVARAENLFRGLGEPKRSEELCLAAESTITDPRWRAEVTAHRAMGLVQAGAIHVALALLEPLLDVDAWGPRAFVKAAYAAGIALAHAGRFDEAHTVAQEALPLHEALWANDLFQTEPGVHHLTALFATIVADRLAEAEPLLVLARDLTRNAVPPYGYAWASFMSGLAAVRQGRAVDAAAHFGDGARLFVTMQQRPVASWCLAGSALAAALRGAGDEAQQLLDEYGELAVDGIDLNRALVVEAEGWLAVARGCDTDARALFDHEADVALVRGDRIGAVLLLTALARCGGAAAAVGRLEALRDRIDGDGIDLRIAQAHAILGRLDAEATAALARQMADRGLVLEAAEIAAVAARRLRRAGDQRRAAQITAFGREAVQRCQGARTPLTLALAVTEPLTARELEVARLAASRLASKEIAERLHISRRTVDNHLRNVYRKLGVGGRAELAEALARSLP